MKKICITSLIMMFVSVFNADAAIKIKSQNAPESAEEAEAIAILENDIRILDEEIAKCEKKKKGWTAATVIGSVGVLSTGIAAAAQGSQISDQKFTISQQKEEINYLNQEKSKLNKEGL